MTWRKPAATLPSEGVYPARNALVESQITASIPLSPSSRNRFEDQAAPTTDDAGATTPSLMTFDNVTTLFHEVCVCVMSL